MQRVVVTILILSCLFGCGDPSQKREKALVAVISKYLDQTEEKDLYGAGLSRRFSSNGKINVINLTLDYDYSGILNIEDARRLIVENANLLLHVINTSQESREFLEKYPMNINDLILTILAPVPDVACDCISRVSLMNERVTYYQFGPRTSIHPIGEVYHETFEEAVHILEQQKECCCDPRLLLP